MAQGFGDIIARRSGCQNKKTPTNPCRISRPSCWRTVSRVAGKYLRPRLGSSVVYMSGKRASLWYICGEVRLNGKG